MAKYLIWTDSALAEYEELLDYLSEGWGADITKRVGYEIEKVSHIQ
jgi:plasmid stabilization system protein ParE